MLVLLPLAFYLVHLPRFGSLQNNDYYHVLAQVTDGEQWSRDPRDWLTVTANEHRATVPALIYALNVELNRGNNRALSVLALACMAAVFVVLYRQLPIAVRRSPFERTLFGLTIAGFVFTPVAAHCVAMGFSGTQWLLANVVSVVMLRLWLRHREEGGIGSQVPLLLLGVAGVFVYTTCLGVWPALILGALLLGSSRQHRLVLAAFGTAVAGLYLSGFETPDHFAEPTSDPARTLPFLATYLGSIFSRDPEVARILGVAGMTAALVLQVVLLRKPALRRETVLWTMLQTWGLFNAVATAIGRSAEGERAAFASRYTTVSGLFWLGLLLASGLVVRDAATAWRTSARRAACAALTLLAGGLLAATYDRGLPVVRSFVDRAAHQRLAALALVRDVRDHRVLRHHLVADPRRAWRVRDFLEASRHVPFDRAWELPASRRIPDHQLASSPRPDVRGLLGKVDRLRAAAIWRVQGWAFSGVAPIHEVVLVDPTGLPRGEVVTGLPRRAVAAQFGARTLRSGWAGYVEVDPAAGKIRVYVRLEGETRYFPLLVTRHGRGALR